MGQIQIEFREANRERLDWNQFGKNQYSAFDNTTLFSLSKGSRLDLLRIHCSYRRKGILSFPITEYFSDAIFSGNQCTHGLKCKLREVLQLPLVQHLREVSAMHMHNLNRQMRMKHPREETSSSLAYIWTCPFKHVYHVHHRHLLHGNWNPWTKGREEALWGVSSL